MIARMINKYGIAFLLFSLALLTLVLLSKPIIELPFFIPKDPNEGWNALHTERLFNGKPLYPAITEFISNNYPPLSFYIVGALGSIIGDHIIAGRIVALISFLITGVCIGIIIYRLTQSISIAVSSSLLFIAFNTIYYDYYIAMDDPQWLAHAIMMIALILFLLSNQQGLLLTLSMLLIFIAGLVKHNLIPIPIAITIWLFLYHRNSFYHWLIYSSLLLSITLFSLYYLYGPNSLISILKAPRIYSFSFIIDNVKQSFLPLTFYLLITCLFVLKIQNNSYSVLFLISTILSLIWGIFISGGDGVDCNAFFDLTISLFIANGLMLQSIWEHYRKNRSIACWIKPLGILLLALPVLSMAHQAIVNPFELVKALKSKQAIIQKDVHFLKAHTGPAICENLAICYWAQKGFEVDFFNTGQKFRTGFLSQNTFLNLIKHHFFKIIQLENDSKKGSEDFPSSLNKVILSTYRVHHANDVTGILLVPLSPQPIATSRQARNSHPVRAAH